MALRARREKSGDTEIVHVEGTIDEAADLPALFADLPSQVEINLSKVTRINSIGINRWIPLVTESAKQRRITFSALPYCVVMQANCLSNLFGGAAVVSCLAPFYCPKCEATSDVLISVTEARAAHPETPPKKCPKCTAPLVLDEIDTYLHCLVADA